MQALSRRKFVAASAILAGGAAFGFYHVAKSNHRGTVRLLPVEGVTYSESFSRFMKRARFDSVRDALASIRDRRTPVRIAHIANGSSGHRPRPTESTVCNTRRPDNHRAAGSLSPGSTAVSPPPTGTSPESMPSPSATPSSI
jgi:hypothetical protein